MESRAIEVPIKCYIWVGRYSSCERVGLLLHKLEQFCCSVNSKEAQIPTTLYTLSSKPSFIITITKLIRPEENLIRREIEQSSVSREQHKQWLSNTHNQPPGQLETVKFILLNDFSLSSSQRRKAVHFPIIWPPGSLKMNGFIYFWGLGSSSKFGWN